MSKPPMSNEAVAAKTGKTWDEWCTILDTANGMTIGHKAIARYLYDEHAVLAWWSQMVTVGYEQIRGLREAHETPDGCGVSVSKTLPVAHTTLYDAWTVERRHASVGSAPTNRTFVRPLSTSRFESRGWTVRPTWT